MKDYSLTTKMSWSQTCRQIDEEMRLWGVVSWDTNYPRGARWEGFNPQTEQERTVELTYQKNGKTVRLRMGSQKRAVDNLRVLFLAIEAMRLNEKRGIGELLESAYKQLAGPVSERTAWEILGIYPGSPVSIAEAAYKELVKKVHPDVGGSQEEMQRVNKAIQDIRGGKV